jgi:hypothetical protein
MTIFNRSQRPRPEFKFHKPERLNRLDHELMVERTKDFDYLYAVGKGIRVRVCVMRDEDNKCFATAQIGDKALKCGGGYSPSGAFFLLTVAIKVTFARLTEAEKAVVRLENPINSQNA